MDFDCSPEMKVEVSVEFYQEQIDRLERREKTYLSAIIALVFVAIFSLGIAFYGLTKAKATSYVQYIDGASRGENVGIYDGIRIGGDN